MYLVLFFDIGSHWGFFTMLAGEFMGGKAQIHAFEAHPYRFQILRKNSDLLTEVNYSTQNSFVGAKTDRENKLISLDRYLEDNPVPSPIVMKIDVEGHEVAVLRGAEDLLKNYNPDILLEVHPPKIKEEYSSTHEDLLEKLISPAYSIFIAPNHRQNNKWQRWIQMKSQIPQSNFEAFCTA